MKYENDDSKVWFALIRDGHHSWPKKEYVGFDGKELIIEFFDSIGH